MSSFGAINSFHELNLNGSFKKELPSLIVYIYFFQSLFLCFKTVSRGFKSFDNHSNFSSSYLQIEEIGLKLEAYEKTFKRILPKFSIRLLKWFNQQPNTLSSHHWLVEVSDFLNPNKYCFEAIHPILLLWANLRLFCLLNKEQSTNLEMFYAQNEYGEVFVAISKFSFHITCYMTCFKKWSYFAGQIDKL
ncbi:hypothetical protein EGR_07209 [Echinococcus granulosus]|uniref:Uncharacterized protein n=1 Tax=Echinococcus granulosus TaxID=6210 RepID=W6UWU4_ECHGR|nr:hypothetical protein EGR_07209 [Echinococcus granulosus]EUB57939.1 hypothetical protein EGR_07209 [Echinococcus granulosus]